MLRSLDLNTAAEKGLVKGFALQTRARLSEMDSNLPQVMTICEMVERGIGVVRQRMFFLPLFEMPPYSFLDD